MCSARMHAHHVASVYHRGRCFTRMPDTSNTKMNPQLRPDHFAADCQALDTDTLPRWAAPRTTALVGHMLQIQSQPTESWTCKLHSAHPRRMEHVLGSNASESSSGDLPTEHGLSAFMSGLQRFSEIVKHHNRDSGKLAELHASLCDQGVHGAHAQYLLQCTKQQFSWQALDSEAFQLLYKFMYLLCRERGKRFITMERANELWKALLHGRFRRLNEWCAFTARSDARIVTEDTWCQVLEFSKHILEDLSNYDINSAWPTLIDEFVSHVRCEHCTLKDSTTMSPSALAHAGLLPDRVSPKAGSKRKLQDSDAEELSKRFAGMYCEGGTAPTQRFRARTRITRDCQKLR